MNFQQCIELTLDLTKALTAVKINGDVISIIIAYVFESRFEQYKNIEYEIAMRHGLCSLCGFADVKHLRCQYKMCKSFVNSMCSECYKVHTINDIIVCKNCFNDFDEEVYECECKRNGCTPLINNCCKCGKFSCQICEMMRGAHFSACFECSLNVFTIPMLSCRWCHKICLVEKYIPSPGDTNKYHPWFNDHIHNCPARRPKKQRKKKTNTS